MSKRLSFLIIPIVSIVLFASPAFAGAAGGSEPATTQFNWAIVWINLLALATLVLTMLSEDSLSLLGEWAMRFAAVGTLIAAFALSSNYGYTLHHDTAYGRGLKVKADAEVYCGPKFPNLSDPNYAICVDAYTTGASK